MYSFPMSQPINEPTYSYPPGDPRRSSLEKRLKAMASEQVEIPCIIAGKEVRTGKTINVVMPHSHGEILAKVHLAGEKEIRQAAQAALDAKPAWEALPWQKRAEVFLKAAAT